MSTAQKPEPGGTPVFYANGANFRCGVYDFQMDFTLTTSPDAPPAVVARVHLSPQLAKVMGRLLRRNVRLYEEQTGTEITLPAKLVDELKIGDLSE